MTIRTSRAIRATSLKNRPIITSTCKNRERFPGTPNMDQSNNTKKSNGSKAIDQIYNLLNKEMSYLNLAYKRGYLSIS